MFLATWSNILCSAFVGSWCLYQWPAIKLHTSVIKMMSATAFLISPWYHGDVDNVGILFGR